MSDDNNNAKKQSFWVTLPGILTAFAALISSVAALVTAVNLIEPADTTETTETGSQPKEDVQTEEGGQTKEIVRKSCKEHLSRSDDGLKTGVYTIDPDGEGGADSFDVWCDMETADGGWTLLAKSTLRASSISGFSLTNQSWVDIFQNFAMKAGSNTVEVREKAAFSYSELYENERDQAFFANIQALGTVPFSQVLLYDGKRKIIQYYSPDLDDEIITSLLRLYEGAGISRLHKEKNSKTGLLLMLGKEQKTSEDFCYYPDIETLKCDEDNFYTGPTSGGKDTSNNTTAFYVGSLADCVDTPSVAGSLWGSKDCYERNKAGGFGGFTLYRPYNSDVNAGGSERTGWISTGSFEEGGDRTWEIYIR
ncbi:MAG: fibrinogen-like YCDxxxxGGGW domain-containing protein [Cyanobacteria bacterium J06573_11]